MEINSLERNINHGEEQAIMDDVSFVLDLAFSLIKNTTTLPGQEIIIITEYTEYMSSNSLERYTNHSEEYVMKCVSFVPD